MRERTNGSLPSHLWSGQAHEHCHQPCVTQPILRVIAVAMSAQPSEQVDEILLGGFLLSRPNSSGARRLLYPEVCENGPLTSVGSHRNPIPCSRSFKKL
ncbi:MAG: hypothetical protein C4K49_02340 [Candidatus Thorarchaeota archaeon]|nr:MAG: hypothetical protein C4K49_02340 [Candidatus Thorarchaeota archaeon]